MTANENTKPIWNEYEESKGIVNNNAIKDNSDIAKMTKELVELRKSALKYYFIAIYRSPSQSSWHSLGLVRGVLHLLHMPAGSQSRVEQQLLNIVAGIDSETRRKRC